MHSGRPPVSRGSSSIVPSIVENARWLVVHVCEVGGGSAVRFRDRPVFPAEEQKRSLRVYPDVKVQYTSDHEPVIAHLHRVFRLAVDGGETAFEPGATSGWHETERRRRGASFQPPAKSRGEGLLILTQNIDRESAQVLHVAGEVGLLPRAERNQQRIERHRHHRVGRHREVLVARMPDDHHDAGRRTSLWRHGSDVRPGSSAPATSSARRAKRLVTTFFHEALDGVGIRTDFGRMIRDHCSGHAHRIAEEEALVQHLA